MRATVILPAILIAGHCGDSNQQRTQSVILLTIDGPRFSETWGDSLSKLIPRLSGDLAPKGALLVNFHNDGVTETTAGHTALTTGMYQTINNSGQELPQHPSVFQIWREQSGADSTQTWIVTSKDKLEVLSNCQDTTWRDQYRPRTDCGLSGLGSGSRDDSATLARAMEILTAHHPRLMLLHFKEPDVTAHAANWSGYLNQIRRTDSLAFVLWNFLQSDPFYTDRTTLFITHDHGRHLDSVSVGFVSHGDTCAGCRKIACLVLGPDVRRGLVISRYQLTDVSASAADLMGVFIPGSSGVVMTEVFKSMK